jgi:hypothetical protein
MKLADCLPLLLMVTTVRCIRSSGLNVSAERKESAWQIREFWKDLIGPRIQWVVKAAADVGDIQAQTLVIYRRKQANDAMEPCFWKLG